MPSFFVTDPHLKNRQDLNGFKRRPFDVLLHASHLTKLTETSKMALDRVQKIDKAVVMGLALALAAFTFSVILPVSSLIVVGLGYAAYQLGKRERAFLDYQNSLDNCVNACRWALGQDVTEEQRRRTEITPLIDYLAPLVTTEQLRDWSDDKVEDYLVENADRARTTTQFWGQRLDARQSQLYYGIYGYQQGSTMNILFGLWELTKEACRHLRQKADAFYQSSIVPKLHPSV